MLRFMLTPGAGFGPAYPCGNWFSRFALLHPALYQIKRSRRY